MAEKVKFIGPQKLIVVNDGETLLNAGRDIYSAWKRWIVNNTFYEGPSGGPAPKFEQALRTVGGDIIDVDEGTVVSPYFFLTNGWRLRPYEGNHRLVVDGNLFVDGGGNPFIPTVGNYNVLVELQTSSKSITTTVSVSTGSGLSQEQNDQLFSLPNEEVIATQVWTETLSAADGLDENSAEAILLAIKQLVQLVPGLS